MVGILFQAFAAFVDSFSILYIYLSAVLFKWGGYFPFGNFGRGFGRSLMVCI